MRYGMIRGGHVPIYDHCSPHQERVSGKVPPRIRTLFQLSGPSLYPEKGRRAARCSGGVKRPSNHLFSAVQTPKRRYCPSKKIGGVDELKATCELVMVPLRLYIHW